MQEVSFKGKALTSSENPAVALSADKAAVIPGGSWGTKLQPKGIFRMK